MDGDVERVRRVLQVSLGIAAVCLWLTTLLAPEGWMLVPLRVVQVVLGGGFLGLLFLFWNSFAVRKGDWWKTGYFRYMREFWGDVWGGRVEYRRDGLHSFRRLPLCISTCRATWLGAINLFMWVFVLGSFAYVLFLNGILAFGSLETAQTLVLWVRTKTPENVSEFFGAIQAISLLSVSAAVLISLLLVNMHRTDLAQSEFPLLRKVMVWFGALALLFIVVSLAIVTPIRLFGIDVYLAWLKTILLFLALTAGVIGGAVGVIVGGVRASRVIRERTPIGLVIGNATKPWKEKVCPLIREHLEEK